MPTTDTAAPTSTTDADTDLATKLMFRRSMSTPGTFCWALLGMAGSAWLVSLILGALASAGSVIGIVGGVLVVLVLLYIAGMSVLFFRPCTGGVTGILLAVDQALFGGTAGLVIAFLLVATFLVGWYCAIRRGKKLNPTIDAVLDPLLDVLAKESLSTAAPAPRDGASSCVKTRLRGQLASIEDGRSGKMRAPTREQEAR